MVGLSDAAAFYLLPQLAQARSLSFIIKRIQFTRQHHRRLAYFAGAAPMTVTLQSTVAQSRNQYSSTVDSEVVMMSIEQGRYFGLDKISSRIWNLIAEPTSASAVCDQLMREFAVDRATCEADVLRFLNDMETRRLIDIS